MKYQRYGCVEEKPFLPGEIQCIEGYGEDSQRIQGGQCWTQGSQGDDCTARQTEALHGDRQTSNHLLLQVSRGLQVNKRVRGNILFKSCSSTTFFLWRNNSIIIRNNNEGGGGGGGGKEEKKKDNNRQV